MSELDDEFETFLKDGIIEPKDDLEYFRDLKDDEKRNICLELIKLKVVLLLKSLKF